MVASDGSTPRTVARRKPKNAGFQKEKKVKILTDN